MTARKSLKVDTTIWEGVEQTQGRITIKTILEYLIMISPEYKWKTIAPDNSSEATHYNHVYAGTRSLNVEALAESHHSNLDAIGQKNLDMLRPQTKTE